MFYYPPMKCSDQHQMQKFAIALLIFFYSFSQTYGVTCGRAECKCDSDTATLDNQDNKSYQSKSHNSHAVHVNETHTSNTHSDKDSNDLHQSHQAHQSSGNEHNSSNQSQGLEDTHSSHCCPNDGAGIYACSCKQIKKISSAPTQLLKSPIWALIWQTSRTLENAYLLSTNLIPQQPETPPPKLAFAQLHLK